MSKIGNAPITIASGVSVEVANEVVKVTGPQGAIAISLPDVVSVEKTENTLIVKRSREDKKSRSMHGLYRSILQDAVDGVQKAWQKRLEIVGTGFNAKMQGEEIVLKVGYSHQVIVPKKEGVKFIVEGNNIIVISGIDKQLVGQVAHQIKIIKKPDPYKGKGIRYQGEQLKLKPGKKAKAAA